MESAEESTLKAGSSSRKATPPGDEGVRFHPEQGSGAEAAQRGAARLYQLIGREQPLDEVARVLRTYTQSLRPPVVGAMQVACADESERECCEAFQRGFVRYMLPSLQFSRKSAFRLANLGGRYEWGSVHIAESHFSLAPHAERWKLVVVKINSHVSIESEGGRPRFGRMQRYGTESVYCGALHALLDGANLPFTDELRETFEFEDLDRLAALRDPRHVDPEVRSLFVAVTGARLQARRAMIDLQDRRPTTPTLYLVVPCVTLNRQHHDTELVVGLYTADRREEEAHDEYCGLGDRPWEYRLSSDRGLLVVEDESVHRPRRARDHRSLVLARWREGEGRGREVHPELSNVLREAKEERPHHATSVAAKAVLETLVLTAIQFSPVPAAVALFGAGLVHVHHASRAHRLYREAADDAVARHMLGDVRDRIDGLSPEEARHLVDLLVHEYGH